MRMRRRLLAHRTQLSTLLEGAARGDAHPEELHEWHREVKRIRVDGRVWVQLTPRGRAAGYREVDAALRRLGRAVGAVRNRDVGLELLRQLGPPRRRVLEETDLRPLAEGLAKAARAGRDLLARSVAAEGSEGLTAGLDRPLQAALPTAAIPRLRAVLEDTVVVRLARLEHALARAYRRPTVARLHRVRTTLRAVRNIDATRRAVLGGAALPITPALQKLQVDLGHLHDLEVLRAAAWTILDGTRRARVDRALDRERREWKRRLVRRLGRKSLRRDWEHLLGAGPG